MAELATVALGSLLGALLGAGSKLIEQAQEQKRRRKALATALRVELHSLDSALRAIVTSKAPAAVRVQIASRFFQKARSGDASDVLLFRPQTVYEVMKFAGFVNAVVLARDVVKDAPARAQDEYGIRLRAILALEVVESLDESLRKEGGILPRLGPWKPYKYPTLPQIPPSVFSNEAREPTSDNTN